MVWRFLPCLHLAGMHGKPGRELRYSRAAEFATTIPSTNAVQGALARCWPLAEEEEGEREGAIEWNRV